MKVCACGCGGKFEPNKFTPRQKYMNGECRKRAKRTYMKRYYQEHREETTANVRRWQRANPDKRAAIMRRYYQNHREEHSARGRRWQQANPEKAAARATRRRAREHGVPATLTVGQREHLLAVGRATYPGEELHLDHVVPLSKGGGTTRANIHAIPANLNDSKGNGLPEEVYQQLAFV